MAQRCMCCEARGHTALSHPRIEMSVEAVKCGFTNRQNRCRMVGVDWVRFVVAHKKGCSEMLDSLLVYLDDVVYLCNFTKQSQSTMPADTAMLNECLVPNCGISMHISD